MMALKPTPRLNPALVEHLTEDARANLAVALLCSLTGHAGLTLISVAMAQLQAHAAELYRTELEKEDLSMITRILAAIDRMEDTWFADALGIVFLTAIIPLVLFLGEVLK